VFVGYSRKRDRRVRRFGGCGVCRLEPPITN
jgi:hypothetical protein